jgi:hypothetical protein
MCQGSCSPPAEIELSARSRMTVIATLVFSVQPPRRKSDVRQDKSEISACVPHIGCWPYGGVFRGGGGSALIGREGGVRNAAEGGASGGVLSLLHKSSATPPSGGRTEDPERGSDTSQRSPGRAHGTSPNHSRHNDGTDPLPILSYKPEKRGSGRCVPRGRITPVYFRHRFEPTILERGIQGPSAFHARFWSGTGAWLLS